MFRSIGAVRKCVSMAWNPASISPNCVGPDGDHQRQPDRRVVRVAAADPVPEPEHVVGVDAERRPPRRGWSTRRRSGGPPLPRRPARRASTPWPCAALVMVSRVVKVLETTTNRVSAGIEVAGRLPEVGAVDVRDEAHARASRSLWFSQRLVGHGRAEVAAPDADVDDVADAAGRCGRSRRPSGSASAKRPIRSSTSCTSGTTSTPSTSMTGARGRAQGDVQHGALLGHVDLLAGEHGVAQRLDAGPPGQRRQQAQRLGRDPVLRVVEVEVADLEGHRRGPDRGRRRRACAGGPRRTRSA